ncbi:hypothetical protein [Streptomyces sp. 35G-GA-8]|uniref:hypothetical protein n=1 Tax=Streptomyces sp. 35G-GA-8 TaxID=2939434 RepID=UPI00201E91D7|nr:hypothetical protein [Streptomyces sp. 35G-GA-8]MCL7381961.1 hypothetical protein [Streptomyces sp. 35G-GA-8]
MGDRQSYGRTWGRRRTYPGSRAHGSADEAEGDVLEPLLARALIEDDTTAEAEQRATAAFRAARDAGTHEDARTRRWDDWRPRKHGGTRRSLKATIALLVTGLTLGGVAVAGVGAGSDAPAADRKDKVRERQRPSPSAPKRSTAEPDATKSGAPRASADSGRPATAKDTEAHCRAYESVRGRGNAVNSTAWQRLITAAGGAENVTAYCADRLAQAEKGGNSGKAVGNTKGGPTVEKPNKAADNAPDNNGNKGGNNNKDK